jgi:exodeoxyribonuclease V alpha subunit
VAETLEGVVERITFQGEDSGYTIAKLMPAAGGELVTVVGAMATVQAGESVRMQGEWSTHPKYGRQFKFSGYSSLAPATLEGIRKYLGSGLIKGIGPVTAERIVKHFGLETLDVIDNQPERLLEVGGTGPKRVETIKKGWDEQRHVKEVMLFLQSHGVSTGFAVKIYKKYEDQAIELVRSNPYRLERDIWGVGFLSADRIARNLGIPENAPQRIQAGIRYVLNKAAEAGHVFLPRDELVKAAVEQLRIGPELIPKGIEQMLQDGELKADGDQIYLPPLFYAEEGVAEQLRRLLQAPVEVWEGLDQALEAIEAKAGIRFADSQRQAIRTAAESKVMVLTGGPGTGKTTITRAIIEIFEAMGLKVLLCSPTGRAAKKLAEATDRLAKTIHRLLGFKPPGGFEHDRNKPLLADALVADEMSMVDTSLMYSLLQAVPEHARLVLVGDVDQLPSVGAGSVLRDLISSRALPVVRLSEIFRQAKESQIVTNAHRINAGGFPDIDNANAKDFFFAQQDEPEQVVALVRDLCATRLPQRYGFDPIEDIQVLAPMYRSLVGASNLNTMLQQSLNPDEKGWKRGGVEFRVGDKVMQIRNNYDKNVFNGDVGRIKVLDLEEQRAVVAFEDEVEYELAEMDELVLAYAVTVHKSQGSEYRVVVLPVTTQHYVMLQRNLLYTAVTRAREMVVIVGSKKALALAVKNADIAARHTGLVQRLRRVLK